MGTILITGGSGYLGIGVAEMLLSKKPDQEIILTDVCASDRLSRLHGKCQFVKADLTKETACKELITDKIDTVFHLASLVSGGAEQNFALGYNVNMLAMYYVLEACREVGHVPKVVFASSIATFGGHDLPETIDDWTFQHPQSSYGVQKMIGEHLINDYTRKGFIDGRGVRLPAIIVRDEPNTALSGYISALIREPVAGHDYSCPAPEHTRLPVLSFDECIRLLLTLSCLEPEALEDYRTINGPGISPTAKEIALAVEKQKKASFGHIDFHPDPSVDAIVRAWPKFMKYTRAEQLGITTSQSIDDIVKNYIADKSQ